MLLAVGYPAAADCFAPKPAPEQGATDMTRRLLAVASLAIPLGLTVLADESRAAPTVDLLFIARNGAAMAPTSSAFASVGDTLTMAGMIRNDQPLVAAVFSLNYDLDNGNELDLISAFQWAGVGIAATPPAFFDSLGPRLLPSTPTPLTPTFIGSFIGLTTNVSLPRTL